MRVLILYTELAGYFLACVKHLLNKQKETSILLIHYPVNQEAPFEFNLSENLVSIEYNKQSEDLIQEKIEAFSPQLILCSGWGNNYYLNIVKKYRKKAKNIVFIDNQWLGTAKQYVLRLIAPFWLRSIFHGTWVPGEPQKFYAKKLGFKNHQIFTGLYVADTNLFKNIGEEKLRTKGPFPKSIISVARYIPQKDLPTLWKAFISANARTGNKWQLNCFGFGELFNQKVKDNHIKHFGFVQPDKMRNHLLNSGIYILPSLFEPWGVAVHEMALSALPMILSDKIGSASYFLNSNNGFIFESGNVSDLQNKLEIMMNLEDEVLWQMAEYSFHQGNKLQLDDWVNTLNKIAG